MNPSQPHARGSTRLGRASRVLPFLCIALAVLGTAVALLVRALFSAQIATPVAGAVVLIALASSGILAWRLLLVSRYRPISSVATELLPRVTVIVPAFNEGRQVYDTLASLVASDYPRDRVHIIAIDDGSTDDTWSWIERAKRDFAIRAIRCRDNRGKRHALYEGFGVARGEVIVTVDSDSEVRADTLRNLVTPLVTNAEIGAVAGVVRVLNRRAWIPRMLDVSFTYSFEFIRAGESVLGGVVCCPGALSAYRRSTIEKVKDEWLAQTVLGRPANIGEDRALTNHVLRLGQKVVLQSNAIVYTDVPTSFGKLSRMLLRWGRSNVRETFVLGRFVFKSFRSGPKAGMRVLFLQHASGMILGGLLFLPALFAVALHPTLLLGVGLSAVLAAVVPSAVYAVVRRPKHCVWGFAYGIFSAFALTWITPLALLTSHHTGWLTRGQKSAPRPRPQLA